ncbi:MAG TPA: glycosyltransferase family 2 protein, partial [Sphingobacteriaceae bacterium]
MKISVVIPTYGRPDLLQKCLNALLAQTFAQDQYEILVVSDGPDKATQNMVAKLQKGTSCNLRFLSTDKKRGPAAAR